MNQTVKIGLVLALLVVSFLAGFWLRGDPTVNVFDGPDAYLEAETNRCIEQIESCGFKTEEGYINFPFWTEFSSLNSLLVIAESEGIKTIYQMQMGRTILFYITSTDYLGKVQYKVFRVS